MGGGVEPRQASAERLKKRLRLILCGVSPWMRRTGCAADLGFARDDLAQRAACRRDPKYLYEKVCSGKWIVTARFIPA